jgi:glutamate synthase (NADPH/NADH) large chain
MLFASVVSLYERKEISSYEMKQKLKNTQKALNSGLLKIMSKMGISTIASYRNSSLFDVIGLNDDIISDCFPDSYSKLSGLGYDDIEKRIEKLHINSFYNDKSMFPLDLGGLYKFIDGGEYHDYSPSITKAIHNKNATGEEKNNRF